MTTCGIAEEYTLLEPTILLSEAARCPVCLGLPSLWQYKAARKLQLVVMCQHAEPIGPQADDELLADTGCPLSMPPCGFYRPTRTHALAYWNAYAEALAQLRAVRP